MTDRRHKHTCHCCKFTFFCKKGKHYPVYDRCVCDIYLFKGNRLYCCSDKCADMLDESILRNKDHGMTILDFMRNKM